VDITRVLADMAIKRPIFYSEADFQHALAWEIHRRWTGCFVRLEYKPREVQERIYLDIWAENRGCVVAIEVKYKTRSLHNIGFNGETFDLLNQSAQDVGRYDFLKDLQRLERIISARSKVIGYAVLLTNDNSYWKPPRSPQTVDANFRIHDGQLMTGKLGWQKGASEGTMRHREMPIVIKGKYRLRWRDYSEPSKALYGKFSYLLVECKSSLLC